MQRIHNVAYYSCLLCNKGRRLYTIMLLFGTCPGCTPSPVGLGPVFRAISNYKRDIIFCILPVSCFLYLKPEQLAHVECTTAATLLHRANRQISRFLRLIASSVT